MQYTFKNRSTQDQTVVKLFSFMEKSLFSWVPPKSYN